jgi:ATP-dependent Clp protease protease subunit
MPYPNFHAARVKDPDLFDHIVVLKTLDNGIMIYGGPLKSNPKGSIEDQAYRFPADKFTVAEAKKWLKDHDIHYILFEKATGSEDSENAILKIYGDIGESDGMLSFFEMTDNSISSKMVSDFLDDNKDATNITVKINSRGGDVQEGWAIYDLLTNSGKTIKTIGESKVYSIATIVFLAGSEREMMKNADGLIHNPFIPDHTLADAYQSDDLLKIAESLKQEEAKILDFYVEKTGTDKAKLAEYMKEDTKLSAEDMLALGFATRIIEPVKAYAYIKLKNNFIMDEKEFKTWGQKLDNLTADVKKILGFSRLPSKDQVLKDKDGKEFELEKETGSPVVGDKASPDGTFIMTDGKTIVIANGVVTEVKEPATAKTELELANEKIAELTSKLADAEKAKIEADAAKVSFEAERVKAVALVNELSNLKNTWTPDVRSKISSTEKTGKIDFNEVRELMGLNKNKTE